MTRKRTKPATLSESDLDMVQGAGNAVAIESLTLTHEGIAPTASKFIGETEKNLSGVKTITSGGGTPSI
ncbi:MAG: hypothetical protein KDE15_01860 [Erythrobacter sp.]|nr:hypothetical protein [Erythrobacter sp.]